MANIPFTHQTISNGVTQASAATMQTVFDAIRMIVDHSGYRSTYELDADTVSGYGIGGASKDRSGYDANTLVLGGLYSANTNSAGTDNWPVASGNNMAWEMLVSQNPSAGYTMQLCHCVYGGYAGRTFIRRQTGSAWEAAWSEIWNSSSDGNGGQPPAPKPNTTSSAIGEWRQAVYSAPNTVTPSGGTWAFFVVDFAGTRIYTGVVAGGGNVAAGVDWSLRAMCWRVA